MSKPYLVRDGNGDCYCFDTKDMAVSFAGDWAKKERVAHYLYKLVADVVVETRTVVEVIEHE